MRSARQRAAAVLLILGGTLAGCRQDETWLGARYTNDGQSIQAVAHDRVCGCLTLQNITANPIEVVSSIGGSETGRAELAGGAQLVQALDWAGQRTRDFYQLEAWTPSGERVKCEGAIRTTISPWEDCATVQCPMAPLNMNAGVLGRAPGDR